MGHRVAGVAMARVSITTSDRRAAPPSIPRSSPRSSRERRELHIAIESLHRAQLTKRMSCASGAIAIGDAFRAIVRATL